MRGWGGGVNAMRHGDAVQRRRGITSRNGAHAAVAGDVARVVYSTNKEDINLARYRLPAR